MGIYFENTSDDQDAKYIMNGIKDGLIFKKEDGSYELITYVNYTEKDGTITTEEGANSRKILWNAKEDGKVIIDGINGELTDEGCKYITICLMTEGKFSTTY